MNTKTKIKYYKIDKNTAWHIREGMFAIECCCKQTENKFEIFHSSIILHQKKKKKNLNAYLKVQ